MDGTLYQWAAAWGVPVEAVADLRRRLGVMPDPAAPAPDDQSEAAVQRREQIRASRAGARLFRNNVGACYTAEGSFIRFGLANESKQMNDRFKSSDLIGITPVPVTPAHVGQTLGVFTARECKPSAWRYTGTAREIAQLRFIELIQSLGGDAKFTTGRE